MSTGFTLTQLNSTGVVYDTCLGHVFGHISKVLILLVFQKRSKDKTGHCISFERRTKLWLLYDGFLIFYISLHFGDH